jgi:cellulose synthase/poly-beta-1,6-N-acetylglucosamine synthase-like glycosyltransferase
MNVRGLNQHALVSTGASWLRTARESIINRVVESLIWRLGLYGINARVSAIEQQLGRLTPSVSTWAVTSWIEQATLEKHPLVSVILPTHNRSRLLRRAVTSIVKQSYPNWEIILVDDGSSGDTPAVVEQLQGELGEQKLRAFRISPSGVCAARNVGLRAARGELIGYLDDDNTMHPLWLKAVVWAFAQRPEVDVVYGGIVIDDCLRVDRKARGALPSYYLNPFNREQLVSDNLADIGVIAHRRGLAEAYFDESLREMGDWDLLVRLTREKPPLVLPVLACFYSTEESDRLSGGLTCVADATRVREKATK